MAKTNWSTNRSTNKASTRTLSMLTALTLVLALALGALPNQAVAQSGQVRCYVEKANIQGDPGDPTQDASAASNYELYETVDGSAPEYLTTERLNRRFAKRTYTESGDAYYTRGRFKYVFDVFGLTGAMTIADVTYVGGDPNQYTVYGKYQEEIAIPGLDNGLMPVCTNPATPNIYCAGWQMDERTGEKTLLTYSRTVTEEMLPTVEMPYADLEFKLTAVWFDSADTCILQGWYEETPSDAQNAELPRMSYNGKTYVNYPTEDYTMHVPKGSVPQATSSKGHIYVTTIGPDESKPEPAGATWQFLYDRERYALTFETNGAAPIASEPSVMYQQSLSAFDPGWAEGTTREANGATYLFAGWYYEDNLVGYSLSQMLMPPMDYHLEARWEMQ